jgi:class 3 adenylate cyclase/tetratricopeptide (TPR) repeat protein
MNCGTRLAASAPEGEVQEKPAEFNLDRYLPHELVTKLRSARASSTMAGERRVITMLFCDVKGSTAAAERVDPEVWTEIMNGVFEHMIRPIYRYEGLVPRLMGDAILAFFGAPITHEDDPQRAVLAGLEIQESIKPYVDEIRRKHGLEFGLRVGINTGLVVVGEIGSDLRMEYTAIGDAINLAARMEQTAPTGAVQISDETYRLVAPFFEVQALGEVQIKGKTVPVKTYRVLGVKSRPGQLRGLEGLSAPLVGRESQLALLQEKLEDLKAGRGSVVALLGEAGIGKSTLVAELRKSDDGSGVTWLRGDSLSYTRSVSYHAWRQVIRQAIEAHDDDSLAAVRDKLRYVCDCCTLPGGDIPFLEALLAVESEASAQVVMGYQGDALTRRMVDATRGFLCGLAVEGPQVLVFDDLHWTDEASLDLLLSVLDLSGNHPLLFVCTSRPDKSAAGWQAIQKMDGLANDDFQMIQLAPLQADQSESLLNHLLGEKDIPKPVRDLIIAKAEGNPFFVEELIRSLIETGQIVRQNGGWRAVRDEARISLPNNLRGVLSARIDRLPETSRHILQNAAVIGRSFELGVLQRLTGLNGELDGHIRYLLDASLIEPARSAYAFRHVLIQEAAYDSILLRTRSELHRQIGEILEELHGERLEEFAPLLAHHFHQAGDARSLTYDILAGEQAARLYANAEAAVHFRRALDTALRTEGDLDQIRFLFSELGRVLELAGRYEQVLQTYNEYQAFGIEHGDRSIEMAAMMAKAPLYSVFTPLHDSALSEQLLVQALAISEELGDQAARARLSWNLMLNLLFSKRHDQALTHGQTALQLARQLDHREQLAYVLNDLCRLYTCRGEFEQAYAVIHEARDLWRQLGNEVMLADSYGSEAEASFNAAEFERSLEHSRQALQITQRIENLWGQSYDKMLMAFVLIERGELGGAIPLAIDSIQLADRAGLIASSISLRSELAWIYAYCGALEKSRELVEQAFQVADAKQPAWKAFPQAAQVRSYLLQGELEPARRAAGAELLKPVSIPYARYTIFIALANIELAVSEGDHARALPLAEELLAETVPLTRVDIPDLLRWKGKALAGLDRLEEALQVLTEARSLAQTSGCNLHLWPILSELAEVQAKLGNHAQAEAARQAARGIVENIADSLREVDLHESFLNQPRVKNLLN